MYQLQNFYDIQIHIFKSSVWQKQSAYFYKITAWISALFRNLASNRCNNLGLTVLRTIISRIYKKCMSFLYWSRHAGLFKLAYRVKENCTCIHGNHYQSNRDCIIIVAWNIYVAYQYQKRRELTMAPNNWQNNLYLIPHNNVVFTAYLELIYDAYRNSLILIFLKTFVMFCLSCFFLSSLWKDSSAEVLVEES